MQSYLKFYQVPRPNTPSYQGVLLRDPGWKGLQLSVLDYARSAFGAVARVMPRSWYISPVIGERAYIDLERKEAGRSFSSFAYGFLGLTPEDRTMGIDSLLTGARSRWFLPGEENVCILPQAMAPILGIDPTEVGRTEVWILGRSYRVIGLFDGDAADRLRDLDNESPMPVDTVAEAQKMAEMAELDPPPDGQRRDRILYAPDGQQRGPAPLSAGCGTWEAACARSPLRTLPNPAQCSTVSKSSSRAWRRPSFVGEGRKGCGSIPRWARLPFPGSATCSCQSSSPPSSCSIRCWGAVYERDREIGIYSSVGLAPNHIAALFIAEALVFATVGSGLRLPRGSDCQSDPGALRVAGGHVSELFVSLGYFHHRYGHGRGGPLNPVPGAQSRRHVRSRRDAALALPGAGRG